MVRRARASRTPQGRSKPRLVSATAARPRAPASEVQEEPEPEAKATENVPEPAVQVAASTHQFPVIGVGASAGGLEAFSTLLRAIPGDSQMAIVLVQHLSPSHESLLPDILGQVTSLIVTQATNGVRLEPGHVYVIPPDARMTVTDGHLAVGPRASGLGTAGPIDRFLSSLADHYQEKAIGVVLSGGGHDGAAGIREIKAAGGITFAQESTEAAMDSMPRAAVATGMVDLVLPAAKIAEELVRLAEHPFLRDPGAELVPGTPNDSEHLRRLFHLLRRASGVDFTQYKSPTLMRRIQRRMALHRMTGFEAYLALLQENPGEVESLYEDVLIHVTSFFREPDSFEVLKERTFPAIFEGHDAEKPVRFWVPGCSSGEEVYSLAIALHEFLGERAHTTPVQIFGTDVSQKMIDRARAGFYPETIATDLTPDRLRRFFLKTEGGYRISKTVRERCVFARQDITRDPPFSRLHLVVCRNLLIYLGQPLQRKAMEVFHYALRPTGFLMLGRSETTGSQSDLFTLTDKRFKIYRKKAGAVVGDLEFSAPPVPQIPSRPFHPAAQGSDEIVREGDVQGEANRLILDRYGPPGVIVDSALRIVRTRGRTSPYLELPPGDASLDVLKLARQGLLMGLRNALTESRSRKVPVRRERLRVTVGGEVRLVNIEVTPIGRVNSKYFLVLFEDSGPSAPSGKAAKQARSRTSEKKLSRSDVVIQQLEEELEASRQYLQSIIQDLEAANEELQSANEEILSSNEELQSTNEELDTAKEELQSTNEELSTLNEELHGRNEELSRVNSDLLNLLASVQIPIVIVASDLRIRRFTPAAERLLNLINADVGRPIGHIKPNIHCPDLEALITEVIDSVAIREREVTDQEGVVYTLRIRPYKNAENRIDGAVLTLFDLSTARNHEDDLKVARLCNDAILAAVHDPVLLLGDDLRVQKANRAFCQTFDVSLAQAVGRPVFDLAERQWDLPPLRRMLEEVLRGSKTIDGQRIDHEFQGLGRKAFLVEARRIESSRPDGGVILLVIREDASAAASSGPRAG